MNYGPVSLNKNKIKGDSPTTEIENMALLACHPTKPRLIGNFLHFFQLIASHLPCPYLHHSFFKDKLQCHAMPCSRLCANPSAFNIYKAVVSSHYLNSDQKSRTQTPVNAACVYVRHGMLCDGYRVHLIYRVLSLAFKSLPSSPAILSPSGRLLVCSVVSNFQGRNQFIILVKGSPSLPLVSRLPVNSTEHVV
jgi:hypothetical protein